jgi:ribosomal-protein-alanine N-acetyltransferase
MVSLHQSPLVINIPAPLSELPPRSFETSRLMLRAVQSGDSELIFKTYSSDPVVTKYMSFPCARSPEESVPFITGVVANFAGQRSDHEQFAWLVFRKDTGECIGVAGLGVNSPSVIGGGYALSRSAWGQGFATEAWGVLVEWAKSQPGVQRIFAEHHPDNPASGNVMRKLGMTCEGINPKSALLPNVGPEKVDVVVWAWNRPA